VAGRGMALTTHPYLVQRLKKEYSCTYAPPPGLRGLLQGELYSSGRFEVLTMCSWGFNLMGQEAVSLGEQIFWDIWALNSEVAVFLWNFRNHSSNNTASCHIRRQSSVVTWPIYRQFNVLPYASEYPFSSLPCCRQHGEVSHTIAVNICTNGIFHIYTVL